MQRMWSSYRLILGIIIITSVLFGYNSYATNYYKPKPKPPVEEPETPEVPDTPEEPESPPEDENEPPTSPPQPTLGSTPGGGFGAPPLHIIKDPCFIYKPHAAVGTHNPDCSKFSSTSTIHTEEEIEKIVEKLINNESVGVTK